MKVLTVFWLFVGIIYLILSSASATAVRTRACNLPVEIRFTCDGWWKLPDKGAFHYHSPSALPKNHRLRDRDLHTDKDIPLHWGRLYPKKSRLVGRYLTTNVNAECAVRLDMVRETPDLDSNDELLTLASIASPQFADVILPEMTVRLQCTDGVPSTCETGRVVSLVCTVSEDEELDGTEECHAWVTTVGCERCVDMALVGLKAPIKSRAESTQEN